MPVVVMAKVPHRTELFTFHIVVIYSESLFAGQHGRGSASFGAGSVSRSF